MVDANDIINNVVGGMVAVKVLETGGKIINKSAKKNKMSKSLFKMGKKKGGLNI